MTPIIAPIDLTIADIESGGATLTFTPLGEPSATYHLTTDAVRVLVDALAGVVVPLPGEVRVVVRVGREAEAPPLRTPSPAGSARPRPPRDVATDPRVGDVLTPPGLVMGYPVIDVTVDGDVWVQTYDVVGRGVFTREHWRIACRTPGTTIERAEAPPDARPARDVATDPRPGDRLTPACAGYPTYVIAEVHNDRAHHLRCFNRHTGEPEGMTWLHWTGWRDLCRTPGAKVERWEG